MSETEQANEQRPTPPHGGPPTADVMRTRDGRPITLERIERLLGIMAEAALERPEYEPIVLRLHQEAQMMRAGADPVARVLARMGKGAPQ